MPKLKTEIKKRTGETIHIIQLMDIFDWLIRAINRNAFYFDRVHDETFRFIELFLLSQKQYNNDFLHKFECQDYKKLEKSLEPLQPNKEYIHECNYCKKTK